MKTEREKFEAWVKTEWELTAERPFAGCTYTDMPSGVEHWLYDDDIIHHAWLGWEAATANGGMFLEVTIDSMPQRVERLKEALSEERKKAVPEVTDAMAIAFHNALTDGSIGADEIEELKIGLRAALVAAPQPKDE